MYFEGNRGGVLGSQNQSGRSTEDKLRAIREAPKPHTVTQLKSFLGLLSYYSKFIPNLALTLPPLYLLLQKNQKWMWKHKQQEAFDTAKKLLESNSLVHYDPKKEICDASPYGSALPQAGGWGGEANWICFEDIECSREELLSAGERRASHNFWHQEISFLSLWETLYNML